MKNTIKKFTAGLLALVFIAGGAPANAGTFDLFTVTPVVASAEELSGTWTDGIKYTYDTNTGILTLKANGSTTVEQSSVVFNNDLFSFNHYFDDLSQIVISEGITAIGDSAFSNWTYEGFRNDVTIVIPSTVTSIGKWAFAYVTLGKLSVVMNADPDNMTSLATNAFYAANANSDGIGTFTSPYADKWKASAYCSYNAETNTLQFDDNFKGVFTLSGPKFSSSLSLTLKDDLGLNFIVENVTADNAGDYKAVLTGKCEENGQELPVVVKKIDGADYYCVTANVPAKNMTDKITAELYKAGKTDPIDTAEYSVKDYLAAAHKTALATGDKALGDLTKKTAQYGEAARYFFLGGEEPAVTDHKADILAGGFAPDISSASISLVLKSRLAVRLYIPGLEAGAKTDDEALTAIKGSNGKYCFEITGVTPSGLGNKYTLRYDSTDYTFTPLSWCACVMNSDSLDAKYYTIANALYEYYMAAKTYTAPPAPTATLSDALAEDAAVTVSFKVTGNDGENQVTFDNSATFICNEDGTYTYVSGTGPLCDETANGNFAQSMYLQDGSICYRLYLPGAEAKGYYYNLDLAPSTNTYHEESGTILAALKFKFTGISVNNIDITDQLTKEA